MDFMDGWTDFMMLYYGFWSNWRPEYVSGHPAADASLNFPSRDTSLSKGSDIVKKINYFKSPNNPFCIDLFLINRGRSFQKTTPLDLRYRPFQFRPVKFDSSCFDALLFQANVFTHTWSVLNIIRTFSKEEKESYYLPPFFLSILIVQVL